MRCASAIGVDLDGVEGGDDAVAAGLQERLDRHAVLVGELVDHRLVGSGVSSTLARISMVRYGLVGSRMNRVAFGCRTRLRYFWRSVVMLVRSTPSSATRYHTAVDWGSPSAPTVVSTAVLGPSSRSVRESGTSILWVMPSRYPQVGNNPHIYLGWRGSWS